MKIALPPPTLSLFYKQRENEFNSLAVGYNGNGRLYNGFSVI